MPENKNEKNSRFNQIYYGLSALPAQMSTEQHPCADKAELLPSALTFGEGRWPPTHPLMHFLPHLNLGEIKQEGCKLGKRGRIGNDDLR